MASLRFASRIGAATALTPDLYRMVVEFALGKLDALLPRCRATVVPQYHGQQEFTAMCLLLAANPAHQVHQAVLQLGAVDIVHQGAITYFNLPVEAGYFRVDLIKVPPAAFDFSRCYLAMAANGELIGRLARSAGFELTPLGLHWRGPGGTAPLVTQDWPQTLELLGYAPRAHELGLASEFRTVSDVYHFVASSCYSAPSAFLAGHTRGALLPDSHAAFLYWLAAQPDGSFPLFDWTCKAGVQQVLLDEALLRFPAFRARYAR